MRKPLRAAVPNTCLPENEYAAMALRGDTEPAIPIAEPIETIVVDEDADDQEITLSMIRAAGVSDPVSDHAIAVCIEPESVGTRRSEIPVADPVPDSERAA